MEVHRPKSVGVNSSLIVAGGINFAPKKCNGMSSCLVSPLLVEDVFDIASRKASTVEGHNLFSFSVKNLS